MNNDDFLLTCESLRKAILDPVLADHEWAIEQFGSLGVDIIRRWMIELDSALEQETKK